MEQEQLTTYELADWINKHALHYIKHYGEVNRRNLVRFFGLNEEYTTLLDRIKKRKYNYERKELGRNNR